MQKLITEQELTTTTEEPRDNEERGETTKLQFAYKVEKIPKDKTITHSSEPAVNIDFGKILRNWGQIIVDSAFASMIFTIIVGLVSL